MKRTTGLLLCLLVFFTNCSGSPSPNGSTTPAYRPAFLIGDQVIVLGGEYAQMVGSIVEVDAEADVYRVRFSDRTNPVFIRSYLLRKHTVTSQQPPARVQPEPAKLPPQIAPAPWPVPVPVPAPAPVLPAASSRPRTDGTLGRLAVLPIIGLDEYVAETVAWHLANEESIHSSFNVVPITPQIRRNVLSEESYSAIYNAGEDVNADYIMTSFVRFIGYQRIFVTVVIDVHTREQLAGDFRRYEDIQDIPAYFPSMARKIMNVVRNKNSAAPKLSVELMAIPPNASLRNDAAVLTQLLAIAIANTNVYAVYPRTDSIDAAMLDYETRRSSARKVFVNKDDVTAAQYVLSSKIDMFDTRNQVIAEIVDISDNVLRRGAYINFEIVEDTPDLVGRLAAQITATVRR